MFSNYWDIYPYIHGGKYKTLICYKNVHQVSVYQCEKFPVHGIPEPNCLRPVIRPTTNLSQCNYNASHCFYVLNTLQRNGNQNLFIICHRLFTFQEVKCFIFTPFSIFVRKIISNRESLLLWKKTSDILCTYFLSVDIAYCVKNNWYFKLVLLSQLTNQWKRDNKLISFFRAIV